MAMPPITVLIDTYNHERFVKQALVSVLEQEALPGASLQFPHRLFGLQARTRLVATATTEI